MDRGQQLDAILASLPAILMNIAPYDRATADEAVDHLGTDPADRERLHAWLYGIAIDYRTLTLGDLDRPRSAEIFDALQTIADCSRQMHTAMATLAIARMTAPADFSANEDCRRAIYPLVADRVLRHTDQQACEWKDSGFEEPLFGLFGRLSREFSPLADKFAVDDFRESTRPDHPALVKVIGQLGNMWHQETGRPPSAQRAGGRPDYVPPFVRFVRAFAPVAGIDPKITVARIARLLSLVPATAV